MRLQNRSMTDWAGHRSQSLSNLKTMVLGVKNGPKARRLRQEMIETVGEDLFRTLYETRLKAEETL